MQPTLSLSLPRAAIACAMLLLSAAASAANVEVHVTGVTPGKGKINVAVCDHERFLKQCAYSASAPATAAETVVTVPNVPAGTWAVLAYQDANENNQLDRNFIGIPSENYGFSRDARGKFGPPSFGDAAMAVREEGAVATVKLH